MHLKGFYLYLYGNIARGYEISLPIPQAHFALVGCTSSNLANVLHLEKTKESCREPQELAFISLLESCILLYHVHILEMYMLAFLRFLVAC